MFSKSYIQKCIKEKEGIDSLLLQARCRMGFDTKPNQTISSYVFKKGDYFHHQKLMNEGEFKIVKETAGESDLYADDPTEPYPMDECILIPTEEQLKAGLEAEGLNLGCHAFGKGAEYLLDKIIESGYFGQRSTE